MEKAGIAWGTRPGGQGRQEHRPWYLAVLCNVPGHVGTPGSLEIIHYSVVPCDFAAVFPRRVFLDFRSRSPGHRNQHPPLSGLNFCSPPAWSSKLGLRNQYSTVNPISPRPPITCQTQGVPKTHATNATDATMTQIEEHDETQSQAGDESMTGPGAPTPLQSLEVSLECYLLIESSFKPLDSNC